MQWEHNQEAPLLAWRRHPLNCLDSNACETHCPQIVYKHSPFSIRQTCHQLPSLVLTVLFPGPASPIMAHIFHFDNDNQLLIGLPDYSLPPRTFISHTIVNVTILECKSHPITPWESVTDSPSPGDWSPDFLAWHMWLLPVQLPSRPCLPLPHSMLVQVPTRWRVLFAWLRPLLYSQSQPLLQHWAQWAPPPG